MRLFGPIYNSFKRPPGSLIETSLYLKLFKVVDVPWNYFSVDRFRPGTSGEADLRQFLYDAIFEGAKD